jgi:hypothetical protein
MKKFALATCIAALCVASLAHAQAELNEPNALGLGWSACTTTNPNGTPNFNFLCATAANVCVTQRLMPTFVSSLTDPAFAGSTTTIDVLIGSTPTIGQWWTGLVPGGCRTIPAVSTAGNVTAASLPTVGACRNVYPGGAGSLPGQQSAANVGSGAMPNRIRISSANSVNPVQALTNGERTYAMQLELKTEGTMTDCDLTADPPPDPACTDGCSTPACFVLNEVSIFMEVGSGGTNPDIIHYSHDGGASRNFATYQAGTGGNCPGATPTRSATWGAVKALYR